MNKKLKINIDRHVVSSAEIASRRNFESVLIQAKAMRKPFYKNSGFIGGTLLALALLSLLWWQLGSKNSKDQQISHDQTKTLDAAPVTATQTEAKTAPAHMPSPKQLGHPITTKHSKRKAPLAPFKGIAPGIPFTIYKINAEKNSSFTHGKGSLVDIPAGSFRRVKDKKVVTGPVDIHYREFSDAFEILIAGITMQYDTADHAEHLQSAGMMEIRGFQDGEALEFIPGKSLKVSLASNIASTDYNVYQLDDVRKQWAYRGKDTVRPMRVGSGIVGEQRPKENPYKKRNDDPFKPHVLKPVKKKEERQNFKLTLTGKSRYKWPYYNGVYFELSPMSKKLGKEQYDATWNDVQIEPGRDSTLMKVRFMTTILRRVKTKNLRKQALAPQKQNPSNNERIIPPIYVSDRPSKYTTIPDTIIFEAEAYPVFDNKDSAYVMGLYEKQVAKQKEEFEIWQKQRERQRKQDSLDFERNRTTDTQWATTTEVLRSFSIANFGTYNCDKIYASRPNKDLRLHLVDEQGAEINTATLSLIYPDVRSVFTLYYRNGLVSINDRKRLILITVTQKGDIAYITSEEFAHLPEKELTLKLKVRKNDFKTAVELRDFLMGL